MLRSCSCQGDVIIPEGRATCPGRNWRTAQCVCGRRVVFFLRETLAAFPLLFNYSKQTIPKESKRDSYIFLRRRFHKIYTMWDVILLELRLVHFNTDECKQLHIATVLYLPMYCYFCYCKQECNDCFGLNETKKETQVSHCFQRSFWVVTHKLKVKPSRHREIISSRISCAVTRQILFHKLTCFENDSATVRNRCSWSCFFGQE